MDRRLSFPAPGTLGRTVLDHLYKSGPIPRSALMELIGFDALSDSAKRNARLVVCNLQDIGLLTISGADSVALTQRAMKNLVELHGPGTAASESPIVQPRQVNLMNRPEYKPPKAQVTRDGALDYLDWPSRHF